MTDEPSARPAPAISCPAATALSLFREPVFPEPVEAVKQAKPLWGLPKTFATQVDRQEAVAFPEQIQGRLTRLLVEANEHALRAGLTAVDYRLELSMEPADDDFFGNTVRMVVSYQPIARPVEES